ncbi:MAG: cytochrome c [Chitinophagaceae bacterium]
MKATLRLMQIMMVIVIAWGNFHLIGFLSNSNTSAYELPGKNEGFCGTVSSGESNADSSVRDGKLLFSANCASCHKIDRDLTGPALMGVEDRWPDQKLLYQWIRNNKVVLQTGNKYANELYRNWNKTAMNTFSNLTDAEIAAILKYLKMHDAQQNLPISVAAL